MCAKFKRTREQAAAIESRNGNLLVSASAGSGKTTVMIERVLSLLSEGASLDKTVICTFTRAAAADMREKLTDKLIEAEDEGRAWATEALKKLPSAEISTIHSWCQRLVRTYFYELGVDPAFEIADESESRAWLNEAATAAIEEARASGDAAFELYSEISERHRSNAKLIAEVLKLYEFARSQPDPDDFFERGAFAGYVNPRLADEIVEDAKREFYDRFTPLANALLDDAKAEGFAGGIAAIENLCAMASGCEHAETAPSVRDKRDHERLAARYGKLKKKIEDGLKKLRSYYDMPRSSDDDFAKVLVSLAKATAKGYEAKKRRKAKLDYSDLEHLTVKLLSGGAREEITKAYTHVFVDEYQDVNPLQERIIGALGGVELFLVGDVKQSIYAFRMCDPTIFKNKCENFAENGFSEPIRLNDNFRSSLDVIDFTNEVFCSLMTKNFGGVDYEGEAKLKAGGAVNGAGVRLTAIVCDKDRANADGVYSVLRAAESDGTETDAEAEANVVVEDIAKRIGTNFDFGNGSRKVAPSDIAVLVEARGERSQFIYDKLRKRGIPASVTDKTKFSSVPEVSALCEFVKLLVNPTDDVAYCAVALSGLGGLTSDDLAKVRKFDREEKAFVTLVNRYAAANNDEITNKINALDRLIARYRDLSAVLTAGELVGRLVAEKKWFARVFATDGAEIKADALNAFLKHANAYASGGASVAEYAAYLNEDNDDYAQPPRGNAVTITTVHASKGLEYPFVYLVGTSKNFNVSDIRASTILSKRLGVAIKSRDLEEKTEEPNRLTFAASLERKRLLEEEKMRLLYVALTRAKHGLEIYATIKPDDELLSGEALAPYDYRAGKCFFDWLRPAYASRRESLRVLSKSDCRADYSGALAKLTAKPEPEVVERMRAYFEKRTPAAGGLVKRSVTEIVTDPDERTHVRSLPYADGERALKKGNAYHKAMELIDFSADFDDEWERLGGVVADFDEIKREELKTAAETIKNLIGADKCRREQPFIFSPDGETLVQGVIDLMIVRPNGLEIVDYKTSRPEAIESEQYARQLSLYASAAEKVLGQKTLATYVYSFALGKLVYRERV